MKKTKFTRLLCFVLTALILVSSGAVVSTSAKSDGTTDKVIADYVDALTAISYDVYRQTYVGLFSGVASSNAKNVTIPATADWVFTDDSGNKVTEAGGIWTLTTPKGEVYTPMEAAIDAGFNKDELAYTDVVDGKNALYTPGGGSVEWTVDLKSFGIVGEGLYSITLDYYPNQGKSASIEREFYINHEAPFSEARALTLPKIWSSMAANGKDEQVATYTLKDGENAASIEAEAKAAGIPEVKILEGGAMTFKRPEVVTSTVNAFIEKYQLRFFTTDAENNELRPMQVQTPEWTSFTLRDSDGFYVNPFGFVIKPDKEGKVVLSLDGVNEPMSLSDIVLAPYDELGNYDEYLNALYAQGITDKKGTDVVKIEAEYTGHTSTNVVYPIEDRTSPATSPVDTSRTLLNTIGTQKWQTAGQWVEYTFSVNDSGFYDIVSRFKQSYLDGMYVSRALSIKTNFGSAAEYAAVKGNTAGYYEGVPFEEAAQLSYDYNTRWQVGGLTSRTTVENGETSTNIKKSFQLYFEKDVQYTIRFEVTLGTMSQTVRQVEEILVSLNTDYLNIIKLTGTTPDDYRDYSFNRLLPDTLMDMIKRANQLEEISNRLKDTADVASTYTGICDKLVDLLRQMAKEEDTIAKNLDNFKSYVGSLGTFLTDAKTQPLQFDYLVVQSVEVEQPKADGNFFERLWHELSSFIQSFFRDYNSMGAMETSADDISLNVWVPFGRDQANVIRNLSTNEFTGSGNGIAVDLKLVTASTLLPSILAGMGPDVYLGLGQANVINYAIRGALKNLETMSGFEETIKESGFNDAAMIVLTVADADGTDHTYGLPENQEFPMMFIRTDILANLHIEIPKTWEDIYNAQTKLASNNMEIGLTTSYKIHLYQMGGELFADDGMRINLDDQLGLDSFNIMCNLFTQYSFPYKYDAANRFRTGEMPIVMGNYTDLYNKLKVFATEIEGSWIFVPVPGYAETDENGNPILDENGDPVINNQSVASVLATVLIAKSKQPEAAWEFIKWYTGAECQTSYANEMVAIIGDSAKHPTANRAALFSMPWTRAELEEVVNQFDHLASVPNYPGYYIIDRYTDFAFLSAYNDDADPTTEILSYINTINKEITRKREEFNLETLEIGQTLNEKRTGQFLEAAEALNGKNAAKYEAMLNEARYAVANSKYDQLVELANRFHEAVKADWKGATKTIVLADGSTKVVESYFVNVGKQTAEQKGSKEEGGGYAIAELSEEELGYFIYQCLNDIARTLKSKK